MKLAAGILLFWFSLLTVQPAAAEICNALQNNESCCKKEADCCKEEKQDTPCKEDNKDGCSGGLCIPCSICSCCFNATIEKETLSFNRDPEITSLMHFQNANSLSGFTSQCFQPPEN